MNGGNLPEAVAEAYLDNSQLFSVTLCDAQVSYSDAQRGHDYLFHRCLTLNG